VIFNITKKLLINNISHKQNMKKDLEGKIVGIFNADFGAKYGFGIDEYYRFKDLAQKKYVNSLIYRDVIVNNFEFDYNLIKKSTFLTKKSFKILSGIEFFSKEKISTNSLSKKLFDEIAKRKIPEISNGILFTYPDYLKCIKYAKSIGYKIVLSVGCHPKWVLNNSIKQYKKFNISISPAYNPKIFTRQIQSFDYADYFIAPTEFVKKTLIENNIKENKIFINPNGVDKKIFSDFKLKENFKIIFLFIANITLMKGLQYLLEAWDNLKIKDAELIICGNCSPEVKKILNNYLIKNKNIKYEGQVSNPFKYYKKSSVFILPSLMEGMPRVVTEAMACGLPVIVTPIASSIIKNGQEGLIIESENIESIEKAIKYFYDHKSECKRMGKIAHESSKKLIWDNHSKEMVKIFETIVNNNDKNIKDE
jgi:glycosyltransferase involved in cell wall biosynthesis